MPSIHLSSVRESATARKTIPPNSELIELFSSNIRTFKESFICHQINFATNFCQTVESNSWWQKALISMSHYPLLESIDCKLTITWSITKKSK